MAQRRPGGAAAPSAARTPPSGTVDSVTTDPLALVPEVALATTRLMATVETMSPDGLAEPSLLPGWTRGHVLSHLCRNADSLRNQLTWARTGVETPAYASPQARTDGIEAGARRPLAEQIDDLRTSAAALDADFATMPASAWPVRLGDAGVAAKIVWRRLREVEVHHVDLGLDYTPADWPQAFTLHLLNEVAHDRPVALAGGGGLALRADEQRHPLLLGDRDATDGELAVTVSGPAYEIASWLAGRSSGSRLSVSPAGPLPALTDWI
jgi:maleylpyruvate isomerase